MANNYYGVEDIDNEFKEEVKDMLYRMYKDGKDVDYMCKQFRMMDPSIVSELFDEMIDENF
jgi:hypothetical protein